MVYCRYNVMVRIFITSAALATYPNSCSLIYDNNELDSNLDSNFPHQCLSLFLLSDLWQLQWIRFKSKFKFSSSVLSFVAPIYIFNWFKFISLINFPHQYYHLWHPFISLIDGPDASYRRAIVHLSYFLPNLRNLQWFIWFWPNWIIN